MSPTDPVIIMQSCPIKIVSGGQTGVDRGALDAALDHGIPCGGWCPRGRLAEDGPIGRRYPLVETDTENYTDRTRKNVRHSDGTLIIHFGELEGGTELTLRFCERERKPHLVIDTSSVKSGPAIASVIDFVRSNKIEILNVAGPRASKAPFAYRTANKFVSDLISRLRNSG